MINLPETKEIEDTRRGEILKEIIQENFPEIKGFGFQIQWAH